MFGWLKRFSLRKVGVAKVVRIRNQPVEFAAFIHFQNGIFGDEFKHVPAALLVGSEKMQMPAGQRHAFRGRRTPEPNHRASHIGEFKRGLRFRQRR